MDMTKTGNRPENRFVNGLKGTTPERVLKPPFNYGSFHTKSAKKIPTLLDFYEIWHRH